MEMKWHPIENGDLTGIQQQETLLFTIFDERHNENYVATGWILENDGEWEVRGVDPWGLNSNETKRVKAWMELPSPFHPSDCNRCEHLEEWCDEFGAGRWCELLKNVPFTEIKPGDCPLNR